VDSGETTRGRTYPPFLRPMGANNARQQTIYGDYTPVFATLIPRVFTSLTILARFIQHFCACSIVPAMQNSVLALPQGKGVGFSMLWILNAA
jgi:hypothetical protein